MKKLLIKIFLMMALSMGLVFGISRIALHVMQLDGSIDTKLMYYISLVSGLCGLVLFAALLSLFVFRRVRQLAIGVEEVAAGNYDVHISDSGRDEIHTLIESFNIMAVELQSNEYVNREYVRNVSHELKTPLSAIIGYAELLTHDQISDAEKAGYAGVILNESRHLLKLSGQMLELSGIDAHGIIPKKDLFRPDEQIRECILLLQVEWQDKDISFDVDMEIAWFKGNTELTRHIWENLISNAVKYCNTGGIITVRLIVKDNLCFEISNTGEGIPREDQPYIFHQFYTVDKSKTKNGTGLGLPLVKKTVERLGGEISFESDDRLTTFRVVLIKAQA